MADIRDILGIPPEMNRSEMKKINREAGKNEGSRGTGKDKLEISSVGQVLLGMKTEASSSENLGKVREAETIPKDKLQIIRARIESNFYDDPHVIEKILDELMELSHFIEDSEE